MAAIVLRLRHHHRHCHRLVRLYSSDNPSDSDPDPDHAGKLYADIKARLRQSPPRRPTAIPPPPPSSRPPPPSRPAKAASLDEIRKHLSEFRSRTAPPNPPSPPPSFSFSEIYKSSVPGPPGDRQEPPFSFDVIRESLRNIRKPADAGDAVKPARPPSPTLSPESLQALKDGLKLQQPNAADTIKDSTFQTKLADSSYRMDYLKIYSHKELGEKLRQLRPQVGKDKTDWFSLAELNERLKKVKAMDEEKYEKRPVGVTFQDLRQCLMMMKEETDNKKNQVNLSE